MRHEMHSCAALVVSTNTFHVRRSDVSTGLGVLFKVPLKVILNFRVQTTTSCLCRLTFETKPRYPTHNPVRYVYGSLDRDLRVHRPNGTHSYQKAHVHFRLPDGCRTYNRKCLKCLKLVLYLHGTTKAKIDKQTLGIHRATRYLAASAVRLFQESLPGSVASEAPITFS